MERGNTDCSRLVIARYVLSNRFITPLIDLLYPSRKEYVMKMYSPRECNKKIRILVV